jgi:glycosyltransferase involved in cell wall biosynthesis
MNIGFYRYSLLNRGGDRLTLAYANHLAVGGHDVTLYVKQLDTVFDIAPDLKVKLLPCTCKASFLLYAATHNLGHDAVIVDIIQPHLLLSLNNRVIYYAQADDVEYYHNKIVRKLVDCLYNLHFHSGRPIISMSQHLTDIFRKRYNSINAFTLQTGIDHSSFYPEPDEELGRMKGNKRAIVFMARGDSYRKGFDLAMTAFESLDARVAERIDLWVCGNRLDQNDFGFNVHNFGVVSDTRLRQILSSADVFFYPSRHEGFGLFPLEAMACGCVSVTTDAIPYARHTPSMMVSTVGDISALEQNLARVVMDDDLLMGLREKSLEDARIYDFEKSKIAFEDALYKIVAGDSQ